MRSARRQWRGQVLRQRNEPWMRRIVERIRSGEADVPQQDLTVSLSRMPAIPKSGFVIEDVRTLR